MSQSDISALLGQIPVKSDQDRLVELVYKDQEKFDEVLKALKAMWDNKQGFQGEKYDSGSIEDTIRRLPVSTKDTEKISLTVKKVEVLVSIASPAAQQAIVNLMMSHDKYTGPDIEKIWNVVSEKDDPKSLRFAHYILAGLSELASGQFSDYLSGKFGLEFNDKLFDLLENGSDTQKKTANEIIIARAKMADVPCVKHVFSPATEESYAQGLKILRGIIHGDYPAHYAGKIGDFIGSEPIVPDAVRAYVEVCSIHARALDVAEMAILRSDLDDKEGAYLEQIREARATLFNAYEVEQLGGRRRQTDYIDVAMSSLGNVDPVRALSMIGRVKASPLHERLVLAKLIECNDKFKGQYTDHAIDVLIARGTKEALQIATVYLVKNRGVQPVDQEATDKLQSQKKLVIEGFSRSYGSGSDGTRTENCLAAFAQINGFANDETSELAISVLAQRATNSSCNTMLKIFTTSTNYGFSFKIFETSIDGSYAPFTKQNRASLAIFALKALMGREEQNVNTFRTIRKIANMLPDEWRQSALEFFKKDGTENAIAEIRHLNLENADDPYAYYKSLPRPQAIVALTDAFKNAACDAIHALMDMRTQALSDGKNDVSDFDGAILAGVRKIFEKRHTLFTLIAEKQEDTLKSMFDRLAEANIIDLRKQYAAAIEIAVIEDSLAEANREFNKLLKAAPQLNS